MKLFELFAEIKLDDKGVTSGLTAATTKAVVLGNAIYNAGTKLVQFGTNLGKSAIEAAATVEAEEAQFNAAFSSMASTATKALKNVQDSTGILYTRLRTVGTKAFAQLKGAGLDSADAMAAMEKYTNLAADAAAYYDISLEDADARLRSFMRGNTEAGDAIGLFTSETQRNDRAMEKYGKKWLQLTEAQKQMLMLDIAGTIYEQSGAIGQAARESDSWANIMGNLGEAWKIAMAKLGSPVKASISPIIDRITAFVSDPEVQTKIEQFGLGVANGITEFVNKFDEMTKDGGVFDNVQSFINDISEALSSEGTGSVLTAIGVVAVAAYAITHPIQAVIAAVVLLAAKWETVKSGINRAAEAVRGFLGIMAEDKPTAEETGSATLADMITSIGETGSLDALTESQRQGIYADPVLGDAFDDGFVGPKYKPTELETDVSYDDIWGFARGLPYVPYDNYIARLHRGEQVLTAREASEYRTGGTGGSTSGLYNAIAAAVREGVSNIGVNMDGKKVGVLVADSVSRAQAQKTANDLRARGYSFA